jgi:hypothetical protein
MARLPRRDPLLDAIARDAFAAIERGERCRDSRDLPESDRCGTELHLRGRVRRVQIWLSAFQAPAALGPPATDQLAAYDDAPIREVGGGAGGEFLNHMNHL